MKQPVPIHPMVFSLKKKIEVALATLELLEQRVLELENAFKDIQLQIR